MEKTGYSWMLLYWKVRTMKRPRWNTELTVKTWARKYEKVSCWRDFEVYDDIGNLIVIGTTQWVLIDIKKQSIAKITDEMREGYGISQKSVFEQEPVGKLYADEDMNKVNEYTGERRDIDSNHHVNNVSYLDIAYNALPKDVKLDFNEFELYYKKQIKLRRNSSEYIVHIVKIHTRYVLRVLTEKCFIQLHYLSKQ